MTDEPAIKVVSERAHLFEDRINELLGTYSPLVWNIAPVGSAVMITCVLVHERELRRQNLAVPQMRLAPGNGR